MTILMVNNLRRSAADPEEVVCDLLAEARRLWHYHIFGRFLWGWRRWRREAGMVRAADCLVLRHGAEAQRKSSGGQGGPVMLVRAMRRIVAAGGEGIDRDGDGLAVALQAEGIFFQS